MKKDLDYYMSLRYEIMLEELSEDDGGGIMLSIPRLGRCAVRGHGNAYEEAGQALEDCKRDFIEIWLESGADIPEPEKEEIDFGAYFEKIQKDVA